MGITVAGASVGGAVAHMKLAKECCKIALVGACSKWVAIGRL